MTATRALVNQATTVTISTYNDGTLADQGTLTVGAVDANGATVTATGTSVTDNSDGTYNYTLAAQSEPNFLTLTATEDAGVPIFTTHIEVVGSVLFAEHQLRAFDSSMLADGTKYSDAAILAAHDRVSDYIEQQTNRSWIRRYCRVELAGNGNYDLHVGDGEARTAAGVPLYRPGWSRDVIRLLGVSVDGTPIDVVSFKVAPSGLITRSDNTWTRPTRTNPRNVVIEYEYGQPYPVDGVDRIAMMIARHQLASSRVPASAQSFTDSVGSYTFDETRIPYEAYHWLKAHQAGAFFG
jgi:hypothetical protein